MFSVGLTGGIGSGKSTVADLLHQWGVAIIDADRITHQLTAPHTVAFKAIVEHFGDKMIQRDGSLNRRKLRHRVFNHTQDRDWLEHYLHPMIYRAMESEQRNQREVPYCVLVIPLLAKLKKTCPLALDRTCVVVATREQQMARVVARDQVTPAIVSKIMAHQDHPHLENAWTDDRIDNSASLTALKDQVFTLHQRYLRLSYLSV